MAELVKVRISWVDGCVFRLWMHAAAAVDAGVTAERAGGAAGLVGDAVFLGG